MELNSERLVWLCEVSGLNICLCNKKENIVTDMQTFGLEIYSQSFIENCILDFDLQKRDIHNPLVLMFDPGFFIGIAKVMETQYLIIGPASFLSLDREAIYRDCHYIIPPNKLPVFCDSLVHAPSYSNRKFSIALSLAIFIASGNRIGIEQIVVCNNTLQQFDSSKSLDTQMFDNRENELFHATHDFETRLYSVIEAGNCSMLKQLIFSPMVGRAGRMSSNVLMQERYVFVSSVTEIARAAMRGGVLPETAYSLADVYCLRMDALHSVQDIDTLMYQMTMDFCKRVNDLHSNKKYSRAVQKCCEYIDVHLHEEISLDDLSNCCNFSRRVVSVKFKKETGMAVPDFIHKEKIKEAKYLLEYTDYTIAEIGSLLQYSSQSYFAKVFRQFCGCTPQQYRDKQNAM